MTAFILLCKIIFMHVLADFVLQPSTMARLKNPNAIFLLHESNFYPRWPVWMLAHAIVNAGLLYAVTHNIWLAAAEMVLHFTIDTMKCMQVLDPHADQQAHIMTKVIYWLILIR